MMRRDSCPVIWTKLHSQLIGASINVIYNPMLIHCVSMICSVLSNEFPLILIIISDVLSIVLGLWGLNFLDWRRDGIRTFTTELILKSRTIDDGHYLGLALSVLLLRKSPLLNIISLTDWRRYGTSAPHLRQSVGGVA
jgi:hypothetical protein